MSSNLLKTVSIDFCVDGIIGSLPVLFFGFFCHDYIVNHLRNLQVIGFATIFFALLLYFADFKKDTSFHLSNLNFKKILIIGCSQILAIIPGTSRAGIIYTTCRFYKTSRVDAAKFSMLLSIPTILLSSSITLASAVSDIIIYLNYYIFL